MLELTTIEYKGIHYPARETSKGLIACSELGSIIWDDEMYPDTEGYPDDEAAALDEYIYGFADVEQLHLPEHKLLKMFA